MNYKSFQQNEKVNRGWWIVEMNWKNILKKDFRLWLYEIVEIIHNLVSPINVSDYKYTESSLQRKKNLTWEEIEISPNAPIII